MSPDQALGQIRPLTALIGSVLIICGVLKAFGVDIPLKGEGWQIAILGFSLKSF